MFCDGNGVITVIPVHKQTIKITSGNGGDFYCLSIDFKLFTSIKVEGCLAKSWMAYIMPPMNAAIMVFIKHI